MLFPVMYVTTLRGSSAKMAGSDKGPLS
jgi:hypothetical protein